jgi:hypothetical protein
MRGSLSRYALISSCSGGISSVASDNAGIPIAYLDRLARRKKKTLLEILTIILLYSSGTASALVHTVSSIL